MTKEETEKRNVTIRWSVDLPMKFPIDWTDEEIEFYLNESSYCRSNLIDLLNKYEEEHTCICNISKAEILNHEESVNE